MPQVDVGADELSPADLGSQGEQVDDKNKLRRTTPGLCFSSPTKPMPKSKLSQND